MKVAIISGGDLAKFQEQAFARLSHDADLDKLSLLPTSGPRFFPNTGDSHALSAGQIRAVSHSPLNDLRLQLLLLRYLRCE